MSVLDHLPYPPAWERNRVIQQTADGLGGMIAALQHLPPDVLAHDGLPTPESELLSEDESAAVVAEAFAFVSAPAATQESEQPGTHESDYRAAADTVYQAAIAVRTSPDKVAALQAMFAAERELARVDYLARLEMASENPPLALDDFMAWHFAGGEA
jgi:hypothetical protein